MKLFLHKLHQNCFMSQCASRWSFNSPAVQKHFGHSLQTYGFTTSCRRMCAFMLDLRLNFFWQMWHVNQVPPSCDFSRCSLSWIICVKRSEQWLHEYGLPPVWIRTWRFKTLSVLNVFPQYGQRHNCDAYGLLLLCIQSSCVFKPPKALKHLLHSEHLYGFSPVWTLMWLFKPEGWRNAKSHIWHLYGLSLIHIWRCRRRG